MSDLLICTGKNVPPFMDGGTMAFDDPASARRPDLPTCVLIVEDNPGDVFIMEEALREHSIDCAVTVLSDGEQATEFFHRLDQDPSMQCPHLVLLDLNLPKRSGHAVLSRIRKSERCARIPVIIVSSSDADSDMVANRDLGATGYFRKPSSLEGFLKLGVLVSSLLR